MKRHIQHGVIGFALGILTMQAGAWIIAPGPALPPLNGAEAVILEQLENPVELPVCVEIFEP
jgi:hypothetical protein